MFRISIQNLGFAWPDGQSEFDELNFSIQKEKIGLVGDNSSGKTTLLHLIFQDEKVFQEAGKLSGGERMRLALACLLAMEPAPDLLILDESTNNLDLQSVSELAAVLAGFAGAILLVTHDEDFVYDSGIGKSHSLSRIRLC
jgi:ATPase subunit of ABC transporter with duplicated ATPase domains